MVPCRAVLSRLELISLNVVRCQCTLGDSIDAVLDVLVEHAKAVPVNGSTISLEEIADSYSDRVAPVGNNRGTRVPSIDQHANSGSCAIRVASRVLDA